MPWHSSVGMLECRWRNSPRPHNLYNNLQGFYFEIFKANTITIQYILFWSPCTGIILALTKSPLNETKLQKSCMRY